MLWLHGQLTPIPTMRDLLLPSLVSLVVPLGMLQLWAPEFNGQSAAGAPLPAAAGAGSGSVAGEQQPAQQERPAQPSLSLALTPAASLDSSGAGGKADIKEVLAFEEASKRGPLVLAVGLGALLSVPAFKYLTGRRIGHVSGSSRAVIK